jgi:hypothetical protein
MGSPCFIWATEEKRKCIKVSLMSPPSTSLQRARLEWKLPPLTHHHLEDALDEIELLGFELSSPYKRLRENNTSPSLNAATAANPLRPPRLKEIFVANELYASIGQEISIIGYLVTTKPTRTIKGEYMAFGTWLDVEGYFFDSTHFPRVIKEFPFQWKRHLPHHREEWTVNLIFAVSR